MGSNALLRQEGGGWRYRDIKRGGASRQGHQECYTQTHALHLRTAVEEVATTRQVHGHWSRGKRKMRKHCRQHCRLSVRWSLKIINHPCAAA